MIAFDFSTSLKRFQGQVNDFARKQVPFAAAQAINALAQQVIEAERLNEEHVLDRPKPFTKNAIRLAKANKGNLRARVWMMDATARYLEPYEFGGDNVLNSQALLKPVDARANLDQYGNLPRTFIRNLRSRKDIFIGTVKTARGPVNGVWQRTAGQGATHVGVARVGKDGKVRIGKTAKNVNTSGHLKLLIKFQDAHPARQRLHWFNVAERVIRAGFDREFGKALGKALTSAR